MDSPNTLRLLAATSNARGDLFTRLVKDLFFALGYNPLRLNVAKTGREVDLQGRHRFEDRRVLAECKAEARKIGGDAVNKFRGGLALEQERCDPTPVAGYFVSLSGFTETAIEQEGESRKVRVILLNAAQVIEALEKSRVLVGSVDAVERAARCAEHAGLKEAVPDGADLLGHERGYLWAVFYAHGKERTHFALIHADGTALAGPVAEEVIEADRNCGGSLHRLQYLPPPPPAPDRAALGAPVLAPEQAALAAPVPAPDHAALAGPVPAPDRAALAAAALEQYCRWLAEEWGYLYLDGMPADTDLSATRLKLERLFVPLNVIVERPERGGPSRSEAGGEAGGPEPQPRPVGEVLAKVHRLALVAAPGGGKSTLVKRLAVAYASRARRTELADALPDRDWLPLVIRCRELRDRARRPILELVDDLASRAGMSREEATLFRDGLHEALRTGRALLLVDGLDEIAEEGARKTFAEHLRSFLAEFPQAALVVTSREAGFRLVAGVVAGACTQARLAPFDKTDVERLCEQWHVEVVADTPKVRADARALAKTIWANERIRTLAENPLLLTTLLVVKRWIGELPRNRTALYREAIRVLVRTWNVEGYEPLPEEETLARLSYVACAMMDQNVQRLGYKALLRLLQNAHRELKAELQFARVSPEEFIDRVEYRSSLLVQTGHKEIDGEVQPVYEFRHLTFQEYLAARGYVEEHYPGRAAGRPLADLLEPHFRNDRWREVIPLAAVLAGRKAEELIERLTAACEGLELEDGYPDETVSKPPVLVLLQCLLDEVQATTPTLRAALRQMARHGSGNWLKGSIVNLRRGNFGTVLQEVTEEAYLGAAGAWHEYDVAMSDLAIEGVFEDREQRMSEALSDSLAGALAGGSRPEKVRAALVCVSLAFESPEAAEERSSLVQWFQPLREALVGMVDPQDPPVALAASWALTWIGRRRLSNTPPEPGLLLSLYRLWREAESEHLAGFAAWTLAEQPLLARDMFVRDDWGDCEQWLHDARAGKDRAGDYASLATLVVGWYRRAPWSDAELAESIRRTLASRRDWPTGREILASLGEAGRRVLEELDGKG